MITNIPLKDKIKGKKYSTGLLLAFFLGAFMVILLVCVAFSISPAVASALAGSPSPTRQSLSWSVAVIAKPTYTPLQNRYLRPLQ